MKRRQEILHESEQLVILWILLIIRLPLPVPWNPLRARWSNREIITCFEPRSNTAVTNVFEDRFADALALADVGLLNCRPPGGKIPEDKRINTRNMIQRIKDQGKSSHAFSTNQELEDFLKGYPFLGPALVVFFSNGSFDGVIGRFAESVNEM